MKVFIEANGHATGTIIKDGNGNPIRGVVAVEFVHHVRCAPEAKIIIGLPTASIECEAKIYGPDLKEIKKIVYADGTETEY